MAFSAGDIVTMGEFEAVVVAREHDSKQTKHDITFIKITSGKLEGEQFIVRSSDLTLKE